MFGLDTHPDAPQQPTVTVKVWPKIPAWSYSAVQQHDKCPLAMRYRRIDRLPEPENDTLLRGKKVHADLGGFVEHGILPDDTEVSPEWLPELEALRAKRAQSELQVAFNDKWLETGWYASDCWARIVMDAMYVEPDGCVEVVEFKTGKIYPEHAQQLRLYALAGLLKYPDAPSCTARIWYIDRPKSAQPMYLALRNTLDRLKEEFLAFAQPLLSDDMFPAKPGRGCNWCHFRKSNAGPCQHG